MTGQKYNARICYAGGHKNTRMWANAQRDGRPAEYRGRSLLNAAVWLTPTARVPCSNAANIGESKTWVARDKHLITRCRAVTLPRRETR